MKKVCVIFALFILGACSSEDNLPVENEVVRLTSEITAMSRGVDLNQQSTQIESGQKVGVTITGAKNAHDNVFWTVGNNGEMTNGGELLYWDDGGVTISAYHPYNSTWNNTGTFDFSVGTDQTDDGYLNSDLLWTTKTASKTIEPIALTFAHKLAKINVSLISDEIQDLSNATISICNINPTTTFNPLTGELNNTTATNKTIIIKAGVTTTEAKNATAIIVPQSITAGSKFIHVELNGGSFYYILPNDKTFESGNSYSYTLNLKKTLKVECFSNEITDWNNEEIAGNSEEATDGNTGEEENIEIIDFEDDLVKSICVQNWDKNSDGELSYSEAEVVTSLGNVFEYTNIKKFNELSYFTNVSSINFQGCELLTDIILPNSLTSIAHFNGCYKLVNIAIPTNVTNIVDTAFQNCRSLTSINLPDGVTSIGSSAFMGCSSLTSINIPDGLTRIGTATFQNCSSLTNIDIPNGVNRIGDSAFYGCI